mgnify:CR=1 FL=1
MPKRSHPAAVPSTAALQPPPTLGHLRALLRAALALIERSRPLRRRDRADLAAMLRAALRFRPRNVEEERSGR